MSEQSTIKGFKSPYNWEKLATNLTNLEDETDIFPVEADKNLLEAQGDRDDIDIEDWANSVIKLKEDPPVAFDDTKEFYESLDGTIGISLDSAGKYPKDSDKIKGPWVMQQSMVFPPSIDHKDMESMHSQFHRMVMNATEGKIGVKLVHDTGRNLFYLMTDSYSNKHEETVNDNFGNDMIEEVQMELEQGLTLIHKLTRGKMKITTKSLKIDYSKVKWPKSHMIAKHDILKAIIGSSSKGKSILSLYNLPY
ncbi:phosphoprotein [Porton virus]|uniref:phosphoprotein n=1 Tax=Porton virus TaxID=1272940 RepID=UPI002481C236|nr:phosphoprotein [Porton virus]UAX43309.1 phosphoprotein [Porton virus]